MSIGKQVSEAIDKMQAGDTEGALYALCSAIDATATKEYAKRGKASFKSFVSSNFGLITAVAFGPKILNLNLEYSVVTSTAFRAYWVAQIRWKTSFPDYSFCPNWCWKADGYTTRFAILP